MLVGRSNAASGLGQRVPAAPGRHSCPRRCRQALAVTAIATRPRAPAPLPDDVQALERSMQLSERSTSGRELLAPTQHRGTTSKRVVDQEEIFHSTAEHRLWVFGPTALLSATLLHGVSDIHDLPTALGSAAAALLAYYVSGAASCLPRPCCLTVRPAAHDPFY